MYVEDPYRILEAGIGLLELSPPVLEYLNRDPQLGTFRIYTLPDERQ